MTYSIGPIQLKYLTNHTWSSSQQLQQASIQNQVQTGFAVGQPMLSYNLIGAFFADTAEEAENQRIQINDIINNPTIEQIYIVFDQDDPELSGWFVLTSLETSIEAAIFNNFPFNLGVRKIKQGGDITVQGWKSNPYDTPYVNIPQTWVALPNNRGDVFFDELRTGGDGGTNPIKISVESNGVSYPSYSHVSNPLNDNTNPYLARCAIYDTVGTGTTASTSNPTEDSWIERFGTFSTYEGDVVFSNNLIRYIWDSDLQRGRLYSWTGANWELICETLTLLFSDSPTTLTEGYKPSVAYFDWNKIIWYEHYTEAEGRNVNIKYKMLRGSYTLHISVKSDHGNILSTSAVNLYSGNTFSSYLTNLSGSNYRAVSANTVLGNPVYYGLFYTDNSTGGGTGGAINLGYTLSEGVWTHLGLFVAPNPIPNSVTIATLARQYLANMDFRETIIDPVRFV
jgi:hypothetical protein